MKQSLKVRGMTCSHCEASVRGAIEQIDPQASVHIDLDKGQVDIENASLEKKKYVQAIEKQGYSAAS